MLVGYKQKISNWDKKVVFENILGSPAPKNLGRPAGWPRLSQQNRGVGQNWDS